MTFTLTYAWWWIPMAITIGVAIWLVLPLERREQDTFGIGAMMSVIGGLILVMASWAVAGIFK